MPVIRICENCRITYSSNPCKNLKFCSLRCYWVAKKGKIPWNKGLKTGQTSWLGRKHTLETRQKQSKAQKKRFQTEEPWNKGKKSLKISGENHYLWKGTTPINKWIRNRVEYQIWRKSIFERDNYICQICNTRGGQLVVDHWPKSLAQLIQENKITTLEEALNCDVLWDTNNNRTLCQDCHLLTETFGRRNSLVGGGKPQWLKH